MIQSVLDPLYNVIYTFFPADLIAIPFFNFLINLIVFSFCCALAYIFFCWPILCGFKWLKNIFKKGI